MEIRFCPRCGQPVQIRMSYGKPRPLCPSCRWVHFANPKVAAVVFLAERDRVLLVKRRHPPERGRWALPAGFVDLGEAPEAAAVREVREETGLAVAVQSLMGVNFDPAAGVVVILYRARVLGGLLGAADDVEEARWFGRDELPELAFASTRGAVAAWLAEPG
jgi:ADP-ribose pyrophosphatase YjhB (NUDIX family)